MRLYHAILKHRFQWNQLMTKGFYWVLILGLLGESSLATISPEEAPPSEPKSSERESRSFNLGPFYHRYSSRDGHAPLRKHAFGRRPTQHRPLHSKEVHGPHDLHTAAQTLYDLRGFHIPLGGQEETQRFLRQQNQLSQEQRLTAPLVFPSFFQPQTPHHVQQQDPQPQHHQPLNIFGHHQHHQQAGRFRNPSEGPVSNEIEFRPSLPDLGEKSTTENVFKPVARPIPLVQKENQAQESSRSQEAEQQPPQLQQDPFIYVYDDVDYEAEPEKIQKNSGDSRIRTNTPTATLIEAPTTTTEPPGLNRQQQQQQQQHEPEEDEQSLLSHFTTPQPQENLQQNNIPNPNPFFNQPNHNNFNHDFADSLNHHQLQHHPSFIRGRGSVGPKVEIVPSSERKPPPDQSNAITPVIINTKRPTYDEPPPQNQQPRPHRIIHNGNQRDQQRQEEFSQIFQPQYEEAPQIIRQQQDQPTFFNTNILNNQRSPPRQRQPSPTPQIQNIGNGENGQNGAYYPNNPVLIQKLNPYLNSDPFNPPQRLLPVNTLVPQNYLNQFPENANVIEQERYIEPKTTTTTTTTTTEPPTTATLAERKQNASPVRSSNSLFTRSRLSPFGRSTTTSTTTTLAPPPKRRIRPQLRRLVTTSAPTTTAPTRTTTTTPEPEIVEEDYEIVPDNYHDPNSVEQQQPIYEPRPTVRAKEFQLPRSTPAIMRARVTPQQVQPKINPNPPQRSRQPQFHVEPQQQPPPNFSLLNQFQANNPFQNQNNQFEPEFSHPPLSHINPFQNFNEQRFPLENPNFLPPGLQRDVPRGRKQPPNRNGKPLYVTGKMLEKEGGLYAGLGILPHHHNYGTPIPVQPRLPGLIEYEQGPVLGVGRRQHQQEHQFLRQSIIRQHVPTQVPNPPQQPHENININTNHARLKTLTQSSNVLANADRDRERHRERERQRDLERERQRELERERQRDLELEKQRDLDRERQRDLEHERERERQQNLERERERQRNLERERQRDLERQRQQELALEREQEAPASTARPRPRARVPGGRRRKVQKTQDQTQTQEQSRPVLSVESTPRIQLEDNFSRDFKLVKQLPSVTPTPSVEFSLPPTSKPNPLKRRPPTRVRLNNYQATSINPATQAEEAAQGQSQSQPTSSPARKLRPRSRPPRPLRPAVPSTPSPTSTAQQAPTEEVNYVTQSSVKIFRKPTEAPGRFSSRYRDETIIATPLPTVPTVIYDTQPQQPQQQQPPQAQVPFSSKPRATIRLPTKKKPIPVTSTSAPVKLFKVQPKPKAQEPENQDTLPSSILLKPRDVLINRKPARRIPPGSASDRLKALQEKRRNLFKNRNNGRNHAPVKQEPELDPREDEEEDEDEDSEQGQSKREITSRHKPPGPKLANDIKTSESDPIKFPATLLRKTQNSSEINSEETAAIVGIALPKSSRNSTDEDPTHLSWEEVSSSTTEGTNTDPLSQSESNVRDTSVSAPIVDLSHNGYFKSRLLQSPTASQSPFSIFTMSNQNPTLPLEAFFPIVSSPQSQSQTK